MTMAPERGIASHAQSAELVSVADEFFADPLNTLVLQIAVEEADLDTEEMRSRLVYGWQQGRTAVRVLSELVDVETLRRIGFRLAGFESVDVDPRSIPEHLLELIPVEHGRRLGVVPVTVDEDTGEVVVATADPQDLAIEDEVRALLKNRAFRLAVAPAQTIQSVLTSLEAGKGLGEEIDFDEIVDENLSADDGSDGVAARVLHQIINEAVSMGATDVHLLPHDGGVTLKLRIDGETIRRGERNYPPTVMRGIAARLRVLCEINTPTNKPQDGSASMKVHGNRIDLRVNILPTVWDVDSVTIRLLGTNRSLLDLQRLYDKKFIDQLIEAVDKPDGFVAVVGRTGDGKSTTIAAILNEIVTDKKKAMSIENPVEIRLPQIVQAELNEKAGFTWDEGLRAFLRSDPDIIFIGEIRDEKTALLATQAAQTGHLCFGTLHMRDAAGAANRLVQMGVHPTAVADSLTAVIAQRLVKKVCRRCRVKYTPTEDELMKNHVPEDWLDALSSASFVRASPSGCPDCQGNGYKGRMAIPELMVVNSEIQEAIVKNEPAYVLRRIAAQHNMKSMWEHGLVAAVRGLTTFDALREKMRPPSDQPVVYRSEHRSTPSDPTTSGADAAA
jgi:type II secretory ATPase GspE/PulE/Tfp pilus assembly ATPase PilB-like protein